jgi:hypothetical protein
MTVICPIKRHESLTQTPWFVYEIDQWNALWDFALAYHAVSINCPVIECGQPLSPSDD